MNQGGAQSRDAELDLLKQQVEGLRRQEIERQRQIEELQRKIEQLQAQPAPAKPTEPPASALDKAIEALPSTPAQPPLATQPAEAPPALLSRRVGGANFRLIDISADLLSVVGGSSENDDNVENLQAGSHDPNRNGFTLQQLELSLLGAVDPYFTAEAHVIFSTNSDGETVTEIEEAFATTQNLPYGLEVEAGLSFTEFGLINPAHPHAWDFIDQPVINSRVFGGDGMRQVGVRVGWLAPLPWFSQFHIGVQNANGETMPSFNNAFEVGGGHGHGDEEEEEEEVVGQRPFVERDVDGPEDLVYLVRWENSWDLTPTVTTRLGFSSLFGPNASGPDGRTIIAGTDLKMTWRPANNFRGWPFLKWQSELIWRQYEADDFVAEEDEEEGHDEDEEEEEEHGHASLDSETLDDWGLYSQLLYGFRYRWVTGLRFEYADASGPNAEDPRDQDPFRDQRFRLSPLLVFHPTEFSRIRLQYNYDWADHLDGHDAHSVWLGLEVLWGAHPAHKY
ncbi:hypothetical protein NKDENANG_00275 [Candidatus Entotheonellaceae bacterium PAL068K]